MTEFMIFVRWIYEQWMIQTKVVQFLADRLFFPPFVASWLRVSQAAPVPRAMGSILTC